MLDIGTPMQRRFIISHHLGAAQARWDRLSIADYEGVSSVGELIAAVAARYSMSDNQARKEVEDWLRDIGFQSRHVG